MSPGPDQAIAPRYESDVGNDLRAARENLGWTLDEVGASLRIKPQFLRAIEEGDIRDLPGNAYAVGFLRSYASIVRLDPIEVTRRFRAEAREVNRKTALQFPAPVPERGVPAGAMVLLGVVIAIGAYVGWYRMSGERQSAAVVQQVPERLATLAEPAKPAALPQVAGTGPAGPAVSTTPGMLLAPPAMPGSPVSPGSAPTVSSPTQAQAAPVPPPAPPEEGRITVRARSDTWVQVRDPKGAIVLNRVLRPGETWTAPPRPQLLLTTGNAGGMDLLVDGVVAPSLGAGGGVRRDIPLDPDLIKDGKLPAQASAAAHPAANP